MVELGETPVDNTEFLGDVVNDNVVRLDVTVHDTHAVGIVQPAQQLVHVETDVVVGELWVEDLEVLRVDVLGNEGACLGDRILDSVHKINNVGTTTNSLQNLDFATNLGLFHGF